MASRSRTTFKKRQKEIARMEKQRDKAAKRLERKAAKAAGIHEPEIQEADLEDGEPDSTEAGESEDRTTI